MSTGIFYRKSLVRPVSTTGEVNVHREVGHFTAQAGTPAATQVGGPAINVGAGNVATVPAPAAQVAGLKTYLINIGTNGPSGTVQAVNSEAAWSAFAAARGIVACEVDAFIFEFTP